MCNNCAHGKDVNYIAGYLKFLSFKFVKTFFANLQFREFQNITKIAKVIKFINNKASFVDIIKVSLVVNQQFSIPFGIFSN